MKKVISVILSIAMLLCVGVTANGAVIYESDTCARSGQYTYSVLEDGTVQINSFSD